MSWGAFRNPTYKLFACKLYIFNIYLSKEDLLLHNQQWLICYQTKQPTNQSYTYHENFSNISMGTEIEVFRFSVF